MRLCAAKTPPTHLMKLNTAQIAGRCEVTRERESAREGVGRSLRPIASSESCGGAHTHDPTAASRTFIGQWDWSPIQPYPRRMKSDVP